MDYISSVRERMTCACGVSQRRSLVRKAETSWQQVGWKKMSFRRAAVLFYSKLLISMSISFRFTRGLTLCVTGTGGLTLVKYTVPEKR